MSEQDRPVEVGSRWETLDKRDEGRVVEVIRLAAIDSEKHWYVKTEAHPRNPEAVGNVSRVSESTLRERYKRVSR